MSTNNAGIIALGGFVYQILVFIAKLSKIEKGQIFEYEVEDDISVKELAKIEECKGSSKLDDKYRYFQIKKTDVTEEKAKKTLFNWLLTENDGDYYLIVCEGYSIDDTFITTKDAKEIYDDLDGKKSNNSLEKKVFLKYKENDLFETFEKKINTIRKHYYLENDYLPNKRIIENYEKIMHKTSSDEDIYLERIKQFCDNIQLQIIQNAYNNKSYSIDYDNFYQLIDEICTSITNVTFHSNYQLYKNKIELNEDIKKKREFIQLNECSLSDRQIITYLENELYYEDFKDFSIQHNCRIKIDNIEEEAIQNYEESKDDDKNDSPKKLLLDTTRKIISNTNDKMQSTGTYISLTSEENKKISWGKTDE
ncbi:MAG: hypothetical protein MSH22_00325 [Spirochaetia bacterium]|nr:hypothetical protein [Spirochaetia bacterium]